MTENKIQEYNFGTIKINNKEFDYDIALTGEEVKKWWRKTSHNVEPSDIEDFLDNSIEIVIIGTGNSGMMKVPEETKDYLIRRGFELKIEKTPEAVKTFNNTEKRKMGFFHLTC